MVREKTAEPGRRSGHRARLRQYVVRLSVLVLVIGLVVVAPLTALTPPASAVADLSVSQSIPGETLIGSETAVAVTFSNAGDTSAYNIAFSVTLPLGVSVSSAD